MSKQRIPDRIQATVFKSCDLMNEEDDPNGKIISITLETPKSMYGGFATLKIYERKTERLNEELGEPIGEIALWGDENVLQDMLEETIEEQKGLYGHLVKFFSRSEWKKSRRKERYKNLVEAKWLYK